MELSKPIDPIAPITYDTTTTPWYFGAYLNMARHNVFLLINHVTDRFSHLQFKALANDEDIVKPHLFSTVFDPNDQTFLEDRFKVYKYLVRRHFLPSVKVFSANQGKQLDDYGQIDYQGLHKFLSLSFELLDKLRNSFSHHLAIDQHGREFDNRTLDIPTELGHHLAELFRLAPDYAAERFNQTLGEKDFEHLRMYQIFVDSQSRLTEQGLYFFICLFLDRRHAILFLKKIGGFKNETIPPIIATIKTFTAYSVRIPDVRLDNDHALNSLLIEVLNELQRCPQELYNRLTEEDQQQFQPALDDQSRANILLNSTHYEDLDEENVEELLFEWTTLKRHSDRFPYFALKALDELNLVPKVRFLINVGRVEIKSYSKTLGGVEINRRVVNDVRAYGKLNEFQHREVQISEALTKHLREKDPFVFDQYYPHYHVQNHKVGFVYYEDDQPHEILWSTPSGGHPSSNVVFHGFISVHEIPKLLLLALLNPGRIDGALRKFKSVRDSTLFNFEKLQEIKDELLLDPATFNRRRVNEKVIGNRYLTHSKTQSLLHQRGLTKELLEDPQQREALRNPNISKKDQEYWSQIIYDHLLKKRKEALDDILPKGIHSDQLPGKIRDYLLSIDAVAVKKSFLAQIKTIKLDTKRRLQSMDKEPEGTEIKAGKIADFLARDIIQMILSKDVKTRITGAYYTRLQSYLAYFSMHQLAIVSLLDEVSVFQENSGHAFLTVADISKCMDLKDFYRHYLEQKGRWLSKTFDSRTQRINLPSELNRLPYSYQKYWKENDTSFQAWLNRKKQMPVDLPIGIFDSFLNEVLQRRLKEHSIEFNASDRFSVLLAKFVHHDAQTFYSLKRIYWVGEDEVPFYSEGQDYKHIKADYGPRAEKNEKKIRIEQTKDRILLMLCKRLLSVLEFSSSEQQLKLSEIAPFSKSGPLQIRMNFSQKIARTSKNVIARDWAAKDFGKFKRLIHDRRLPLLFEYIACPEVPYEFIDYQLSCYDRVRPLIFQRTFEFESTVALKYLPELAKKEGVDVFIDYPEVPFNIYLDVLEDQGLLNARDKKELLNIRNRFSHSEFPNVPDDVAEDHKVRIFNEEDMESFLQFRSVKGKITADRWSIAHQALARYGTLLEKYLNL